MLKLYEIMAKKLTLILWNIRSIYNVGAILRTAEGLGVERVVYSGYTPNPAKGLPHEREKLVEALHKTALGAELSVPSEYVVEASEAVARLREEGYAIWALEQAENSVELGSERFEKLLDEQDKIALILGEERYGITTEILAGVDQVIEIPMKGIKESFNVSVAAGIAIWELS